MLSQVYFSKKTINEALDENWNSQERTKLEEEYGSLQKIRDDPVKMRTVQNELVKARRKEREERTRQIVAGEVFDGINLLEFMPDVNLKTSTAIAISARASVRDAHGDTGSK